MNKKKTIIISFAISIMIFILVLVVKNLRLERLKTSISESANSVAMICDKNNLKVGESTNCKIIGNINSDVVYFKSTLYNPDSKIVIEQVTPNEQDNWWGMFDEEIYNWGDNSLDIAFVTYPTVKGRFEIATVKIKAIEEGNTNFILNIPSFGIVSDRSVYKGQVYQTEDVLYLNDYTINIGVEAGLDISRLKIKKSKYVLVNYGDKLKTITDLLGTTNNISATRDNSQLSSTTIFKTNDVLKVNNTNYTITILGDVNKDGIVTISDVSKIYRVSKGTATLTEIETVAGDYNENGTVNITDVSGIYRMTK